MVVTGNSGDLRTITLGNNEIERLENRVMVEICEDFNFIKEVAIPRDQFRGAAAIRCFQDVRRGQRFHRGISSMDS